MPGDPLLKTLDELTFFNDTECESITGKNVRELLRSCDVKTGQDIVALGCTGLLKVFCRESMQTIQAIKIAQFVQAHIAGAGIGLPCYVPPTKFCLIHEIVGGLQDNQRALHSDMLPFGSRKLTKAEFKHSTAIDVLRAREGAQTAIELYDVEIVSGVQTESFSDRIARWTRKLFRRG